MSKAPSLTTARVAEVYATMIHYRREFCADSDFPKMTDVWEEVCAAGDGWKINFYNSNRDGDHDRKLSVVALDHRVTLTVDHKLWQCAELGGKFENFTLAHELGHICVGHFETSPKLRHFQLSATRHGMSIGPASIEEREANLAGVFFPMRTLADGEAVAISGSR